MRLKILPARAEVLDWISDVKMATLSSLTQILHRKPEIH